MNSLKIAVWSIGEHAIRNILPAIKKSSQFELVAIHTRKKNILLEESQKYDCIPYDSCEDLLNDKNIDAIYICSPNSLHFDQAIKCLNHNKHVIIEKSAFSKLEEATNVTELAKKKNLILMEAFMFLHHRQWQEVKKILASKKYGDIHFINASFGFPHLEARNIRYSKELAGGALNDAGAYTARAILDLFGYDCKLEYSSIINESDYEVDTSGIAVFKKGLMRASCRWGMGVSYKNSIDIWCELGHIKIDRAFSKPSSYESKIDILNNGEIIERILSGRDNHFIKLLNSFANNIISLSDKPINEIRLQAKLLDEIRKNDNTILN